MRRLCRPCKKGNPTGAIFNAHSTTGLFTTDQRARMVGDLLTVAFTESFAASKSQSTATSRSDEYGFTINNIPFDNDRFSNYSLGGQAEQSFAGTGQASQSNTFTGRLSVSVVRVFANGNLEIMGQKMLTLNNGNEYVRVRALSGRRISRPIMLCCRRKLPMRKSTIPAQVILPIPGAWAGCPNCYAHRVTILGE